MTARRGVVAWLAARRHPRLTLLGLVGTAAVLLGTALWLARGAVGDAAAAGWRLAALGAIVVLFAGTGAVAFAVFERAFEEGRGGAT